MIVIIYRLGGGGERGLGGFGGITWFQGKGGGRKGTGRIWGDHVVSGERRGEQSSLTEFKEGSIKVYR